MSRRLTITARARADLAQARLWYTTIRVELADEFFEDIDRTFAALRERPASFPEVDAGVRRAVCDTFPYKVFFRLKGDGEVRVLAIYHASRDPGKWQDRG